MRILVTGSTGFIGANLALKLAETGNIVHALYRSTEKVKRIQHSNIQLFKGDINDIISLKAAMKGCSQIYHIAAFTDVWTKNNQLIYNLNVTGTENVLELALKMGIQKVVFTSTAGVLGPSFSENVTENTQKSIDFFLEYERTKSIAETRVNDYVKKGLNCVIVNPTRVYGPGLLSKSNSVTIMIKSYSAGKWRVIPGNGESIGNYVFIDDVINGHILAMEKGKAGERYILGGSNISYLDFFQILKNLTGRNHFMIKLPLFIMLSVSYLMMFLTKAFDIKPLITPSLVRKFNYNWNISSAKAINELGYQPISFNEGARKTLEWIEANKLNDK